MSVTELRQRQSTLESVRLDLPRWGLGPGSRLPVEQQPLVAVDWSEIYSFLTQTPPRENASVEVFDKHYAGLSYLLFRLP
jgi:hypothetical protein